MCNTLVRTVAALAAIAFSTIGARAQDVVCPAATGNCLPIVEISPSNQIAGNAAGTTGAVVGTLTATTVTTAYLCDFDVQAIGGTAAVGPITVAGLLGGSRVYQGSSTAAGGTVVAKSFRPCLPASAKNTNITITTTADATASAVDVNSSGYLQ